MLSNGSTFHLYEKKLDLYDTQTLPSPIVSAEFHAGASLILIGTANGKVCEYSVKDKKFMGDPVRIGGESQ